MTSAAIVWHVYDPDDRDRLYDRYFVDDVEAQEYAEYLGDNAVTETLTIQMTPEGICKALNDDDRQA